MAGLYRDLAQAFSELTAYTQERTLVLFLKYVATFAGRVRTSSSEVTDRFVCGPSQGHGCVWPACVLLLFEVCAFFFFGNLLIFKLLVMSQK